MGIVSSRIPSSRADSAASSRLARLVKRDGRRTPRTCAAPSASTATAAVSAESMPPDMPKHDARKAVLAHVVAQAEHHRAVDRFQPRLARPLRVRRRSGSVLPSSVQSRERERFVPEGHARRRASRRRS